jgi:hypothetical protein
MPNGCVHLWLVQWPGGEILPIFICSSCRIFSVTGGEDDHLRGGSAWIKAAVTGFLTRQDEDLLDVGPPSSSRSDEFWKAPPVNGTVHLLPEICGIGWYSVAGTHAFISTVWFGSGAKLCFVLTSSDFFDQW